MNSRTMPSGDLKRESEADVDGAADAVVGEADDGSGCISSKPAVVKKADAAAGVIVVTHWR